MTGTDSTAIARRHPWGPADITALQRLWDSGVPVRDIAAQLERPLTNVKNAAQRYCGARVPVYREYPRWTPEEVALLTVLWPQQALSPSEIACQVGHSRRAVHRKVDELGLPRTRRQPWTAEGDALCLSALPTYRVAQKTGRSPSAVAHRRAALMRLRDGQGAMTLYLSGPITGMPDYAARFAAAARILREAGYTVVNPVDLCEEDWDWDRCMMEDLAALRTCEGVAVLDGWEASRGSRIELGEAFQRGLPVRTVAAWVGIMMLPIPFTGDDWGAQ